MDEAAAKLMHEHGAFVVPTLVTYDALAKHGAEFGMPPESVAKVASVQQKGRESLEIYANAGVKMGFGSDLLGEMHAFQSGEFRIRAEVLGNLEALRSATTAAAEIVNMQGQLGVVAAGLLRIWSCWVGIRLRISESWPMKARGSSMCCSGGACEASSRWALI